VHGQVLVQVAAAGSDAFIDTHGDGYVDLAVALGDHDQARGHFASSPALYQGLGNRLGEARIHQNLGLLAERLGRYAAALGHAEQALRLYQAIGDQADEATTLNDVGWYHDPLGDYQQARAFCRQALTLCGEASGRWLEGEIWDSLGYAEHHLGNLAEAAVCYQRALSIAHEHGDRFHEAEALTYLADTRYAVGELAQAQGAWQQAVAILEELQHPGAEAVRGKSPAQPAGQFSQVGGLLVSAMSAPTQQAFRLPTGTSMSPGRLGLLTTGRRMRRGPCRVWPGRPHLTQVRLPGPRCRASGRLA
jgi:tetratricopeptide (TPR) repeat protein